MRTARRWLQERDSNWEPLYLHIDTSLIGMEGTQPSNRVILMNIYKGNVSTDFVIEWGDGAVSTYNDLPDTPTSVGFYHDYADLNTQATITVSAAEATLRFYGPSIYRVSGYFPRTYQNNTTMEYSLSQCHSLYDIADTIFEYNTHVEVFNQMFSGAIKLTTVPENLFRKNINVLEVFGLFSYSGITTIPENLLKYNTKLVSARGLFGECPSLKTVPENIFKYNTELEDVSALFGCAINYDHDPDTGDMVTTSRSALISIPESLFINNPKLTTISRICIGCLLLLEVPEHLFANNLEIVTADQSFYECQKIVSAVPELWLRPLITGFLQCYFNCTSAANYASIPSNWK